MEIILTLEEGQALSKLLHAALRAIAANEIEAAALPALLEPDLAHEEHASVELSADRDLARKPDNTASVEPHRLDISLAAYDPAIHSSSRKILKNGLWQLKRVRTPVIDDNAPLKADTFDVNVAFSKPAMLPVAQPLEQDAPIEVSPAYTAYLSFADFTKRLSQHVQNGGAVLPFRAVLDSHGLSSISDLITREHLCYKFARDLRI